VIQQGQQVPGGRAAGRAVVVERNRPVDDDLDRTETDRRLAYDITTTSVAYAEKTEHIITNQCSASCVRFQHDAAR